MPTDLAPIINDLRVIVAHQQRLEQRIGALEQALQGVPRAIGVLGSLSRALGARILALVALLGCLALSILIVTSPTLPGLILLAILVGGLHMPLIVLAYLRDPR